MRSSPRKIAPIVILAFAIAACKPSEAPPAPVTPPDLETVSAGNEPRQLLRYKASAGTAQRLELTIAVELTAGDMGGPMPTIALTVTYVVDAVLPTGQMTLRWTIDHVRALETEGSKIPPAALNGPLETLKGLTIFSVLSSDGRITGSSLAKSTRPVPPELEAQLTSLIKSFETTMMPLPVEPVGVGAVWRNSRAVEHNGMKLKAVNTVSLTAITGDVIEYSLDTTIHGEDQSVTQEGMTITVKDIVGNGAGKGTIVLSTLAITSELIAELRSEMFVVGDPAPTKMQMATLQKVRPL